MIKYFNYILFTVLIFLVIIFESNSKISTNLYSMLPNSDEKELVTSFLKLNTQKKIFLTIKGTNKESLKILRSVEKEFLQVEGIEKEKFTQNTELLEYQKKYKMYLEEFNTEKIQNLEVKKTLTQEYQNLFDEFISSDINAEDPLKLFNSKKQSIHIKNGKLLLGEYGYLSIFTLSSDKNSLKSYEKIYDQIKTIENDYDEITTFSPIYYFVENSRYIKNDSSIIIILASIILLLLYIVFLRNIHLLLNTLLTLGASALIATIILTFMYDEISLFVLIFGISISTIAIDYMFHHYFHKNYEYDLGFNKEVFLGFLTTFVAFFILSFVDFLLIKQITQFAMISLLSSYLLFAFIYPRIKFAQNEFKLIPSFSFLDARYLFIFAFAVLIYSLQNLNFNFDVQSLNYDNKSLKAKELFFKEKMTDIKLQPVLIKSKTIDQLVQYNEEIYSRDIFAKSSLDSLISKKKFLLKQKKIQALNFDKIRNEISSFAPQIGFKKDAFNAAYNYELEMPSYTQEELQSLNINIQKHNEEYISLVYISNEKFEEIIKLDFVYSMSIKKLFEKSLEKDLKKMILFGLLSLGFILMVVMFIAKKKVLYALSFLIVPSAVIFLYLSFISVNILHIFIYFIIIAISVDYAIYSTKDNSDYSKKAIIFSALSSFAGFGVLVFSSTPSLYSIGSVATLGIIAILILIIFGKEYNES